MESDIVGNLMSWAVGVPSVGVIIAYGISIIRRRASADTKSLKEDESYQNMLESYRVERNEAKLDRERIIERMAVLEVERNEAVSKVGKLTAEVEYLTAQVKDLKKMVEELASNLNKTRTDLNSFAIENAKFSSQVQFLERLLSAKEKEILGGNGK